MFVGWGLVLGGYARTFALMFCLYTSTMSLCLFVVDELTLSRSLVYGLPKLVMSTAPEVDFNEDKLVVQRAEAVRLCTPPIKIMQYLKQLKDAYLSGDVPGAECSFDARARRIAKEDSGECISVCKWRMDGIFDCDFATTTVLDEMTVFEWIYGIKCFDAGLVALRKNKPADAGRWFVHATTSFKLLARTGAREGFMRFKSSHPIMFKAYPCQAWALLSHAFSHVAAANMAFTSHSTEAMTKLCLDGIKHAVVAGCTAKMACTIIINDTGLDSLSGPVLSEFIKACHVIRIWGQFQTAVYHFYDMTLETLALDHINYCIGDCTDNPALYKEMTAVRTSLTYEKHGFMNGLVTSLKGAVTFTEPEPLPEVPDTKVNVPSFLPERLLFPI